MVMAEMLRNLTSTPEDASAVFEAGYLGNATKPLLLDAVKAEGGESDRRIQEVLLMTLGQLLGKCREACLAAAKQADAKQLVKLLELGTSRGEEYLCLALDLTMAVAVEDGAEPPTKYT